MSFGNNIEAMASEKSGWAIIDQSADGSVIYMGKPISDSVKLSDNAWLIKKITTTTNEDGSQIIKTQYAEPRYKCSWNERKELEYSPTLLDIRKIVINGTFDHISDFELTFEYGMTWQEWINSDYNVHDFTIKTVAPIWGGLGEYIIVLEAYGSYCYISNVAPSDLMQEEYDYNIEENPIL